ncbi:hypothetical protein [Litchfieldia salsa]|uniref:Uncharacterized protein n=1 Tax=Litchfieldia salsa TaxID=930152 RepID=A0A1H0SLP6_9BACI|nr:hypothetical protein [Litchfieldia salsa]SDP42671.1 hypothetical protein SAMN05216565_1034 [Litchfieldia salsa]
MGRQIEYYMELESYKLLVKKAFELGFKVIHMTNDLQICSSFNEIRAWDSRDRIYFYLEEAGQLIVKENGYIDTFFSPVVESGYSYLNEKRKTITKGRIWVSSHSWRNEGDFNKRSGLLDKKYSSLMRYVKKIAPYTEVEVKAQNPIYEGKKFKSKEYITPFLLNEIKQNKYDCI